MSNVALVNLLLLPFHLALGVVLTIAYLVVFIGSVGLRLAQRRTTILPLPSGLLTIWKFLLLGVKR